MTSSVTALSSTVALWLALVLICAGTPSNHAVKYVVSGSARSASLTYSNEAGDTAQIDAVRVPWTSPVMNVVSGSFLYVSAQNTTDVGDITTRIYVDGNLIKSTTSQGAHVIATSSVRCPY